MPIGSPAVLSSFPINNTFELNSPLFLTQPFFHLVYLADLLHVISTYFPVAGTHWMLPLSLGKGCLVSFVSSVGARWRGTAFVKVHHHVWGFRPAPSSPPCSWRLGWGFFSVMTQLFIFLFLLFLSFCEQTSSTCCAVRERWGTLWLLSCKQEGVGMTESFRERRENGLCSQASSF